MLKTVLFTAALLMPGLAYGGNPSADLSVQVVPAGKAGTCGTSMGQAAADAAAAGFNTCALYNDFTTAIPNNVGTGLPSNWLNCSNNTDTNAVWNAFGNVNVPCPAAYQQVTDTGGGGNLALDMHYNHAWMVQASIYNNYAFLSSIPVGLGTSNNIPAHSWSNGYFEITARMTADVGNFPGEVQSFWAWLCCTANVGFVEQDFFEDWSTGGQSMDTAYDWWTTPWLTGQGYSNGPRWPAHTQSDYHTFGYLLTGPIDHFAVCTYFDGTKVGCSAIQNYRDAAQNSAQRRVIYIQNGAQCNTATYGDISCVGNSFTDSHMYIKSIKVMTCASEPTGGSCLGNTYNGSFYQP